MDVNSSPVKIKIEVSSIDFQEYTLSNGLKVVLCKFGNIPMVAVNTTFHVGSKDEEEDRTGLAHLFEHLMFEGSKNVPGGQFDKILTQYGGESNAYTSYDSTSYYIVIPSQNLEAGLWLDSDRVNNLNITEESLKVQKDVVFEEKLLYVDNTPYGTLEEESARRLFKTSGYKTPVIGDMKDLRKATLKDVYSFYEKYYKPGNAVISIVGDIDYGETLRLVEKYYGDVKPGEKIVRKSYNEEDIKKETRLDIPDNIQLRGKFIFYRVPAMGTKHYYSMSILNGILSEGESSRLYYDLEYKNRLVNEIDSNFSGMENASIFSISALAMKDKNFEEIENRIDDIIENIKKGDINDSEIQKIKNKVETFYNMKRQSINALADKFSYLKTFYNDCHKINFEILDYLSVTRDDIIETANKFLGKDQRVVLNYLPINKP